MAYTGQTAGVHAGVQSNDVELSLALELDYGKYSGGAFQQLRFTNETLREQSQRIRPPEITGRGEVCPAFTSQISISGTLTGAFSIGGYDRLFAAILGSTPQNGSMLNDRQVRSWTLCARYGAGWIVRYGCVCTKVQLTLSQGSYAQVAFDFTCAKQTYVTQDPATLRLEAPVGAVLDTAGNFDGLLIDGVPVDGAVRSFSLTLGRDGSTPEYGLGKAGPCGQKPDDLTATGSVQIFFRSFDLYRRYQRGLSGPVVISVNDGNGNAYVFSFLNATLQNPRINAGGRNTSILATFDIEGNPLPDGGTFALSRHTDPFRTISVSGAPVTFNGTALRP
ncbi:MAG: phage tail tube protein [Gluconobacter cerinus]|uniref:phage tail tube protein n=1 Tax=Gluconobacter cerinus TaxID=38307 RepID=UPI0039E95C81